MAEQKAQDDISEFTFEEAIKELTGIVSHIEQGHIPLSQSLEQYEKGMELIKHCRTILNEAEQRIEKISKQGRESSPKD